VLILALVGTGTLASISFVTAQEESKSDDMSFPIQETKTSEPDTLAPGHEQYHQIAIALPERDDTVDKAMYAHSNVQNRLSPKDKTHCAECDE
jgi:hypothetical protein